MILDLGLLEVVAVLVALLALALVMFQLGQNSKEQEYERLIKETEDRRSAKERVPTAYQPPDEFYDIEIPRKMILVIGVIPSTRLVEAYLWDRIPSNLNVADYDIVIVHLGPLQDDTLRQGLNLDRIPTPQQFARLIFSDRSEVYFIGDPGIVLAGRNNGAYRPIAYYLPKTFAHRSEISNNIEVCDSRFSVYFEQVAHTTYHFDPSLADTRTDFLLSVVHPHATAFKVIEAQAIARTRFGKVVAFYMRYIVVHHSDQALRYPGVYDEEITELGKSGTVYWLPVTTSMNDTDAIDLLLRERLGIRFKRSAPTWIDHYTLPWQVIAESRYAACTEQIEAATCQSRLLMQELESESRFLQLLYEKGEDVLEPVVRDALRQIGATVTDPKVRGRDDGRLIDPSGRHAILEIKGRDGHLRLSDLRELDNWVRSAIADEQWQGKGIMIANVHCSQPPEDRGPLEPNSQFLRTAEQYGLCLMTSVQLFEVLVAFQGGTLVVPEFWDSIFTTSGLWVPPSDIKDLANRGEFPDV